MHFIFYIYLINTVLSSPSLPDGLKLVFEDNFEGGTINRDLWDVECYVDHPEVLNLNNDGDYKLKEGESCSSKLSNGCNKDLQLPIISGKIHSKLNSGFRYGRFEMRAQLPIGNYLWPTFWLLPVTDKYGTWPTGGEIDILEAKGHMKDKVEFTLHHGGKWPNNQYFTTPHMKNGLFDGYHTFGIDYTKNYIKFFIDDNYVHNVELNRDWSTAFHQYNGMGIPFIDQEWYMIIDLAIAGNYFGPGWKFDKYNDPKSWKQNFNIDFVKVYQF
ncbi:concanavalin A-like lectin/glucanase [Neoconidiobolus thromboides FSU 785]|nr:concanavalin A-like lectin/glucanase [Neoconidiobolus thromboides FSU 785]